MAGEAIVTRKHLIQDLERQLDTLARFNIQYGIGQANGVEQHRESILHFIQSHGINVMEEMEPLYRYYYRRFLC